MSYEHPTSFANDVTRRRGGPDAQNMFDGTMIAEGMDFTADNDARVTKVFAHHKAQGNHQFRG